jgi:hypothetical protein
MAEQDLAWVKNEEAIREVMQSVFQNGNGPTALTIIGNQLGAFATKPDEVDPKLIAHWHWILAQIGVIHPGNLEPVTRALLAAANNDDLVAIRMEAEAAEKQ